MAETSPKSPTAKASGESGTTESGSTSSAKASPAPKADSPADNDTARRTGARTGGTTELQQAEYAASGANPALDNRTGDQRPPARAFAPKPQQFPGPEVGHIAEHAAAVGPEFHAVFDDDEADDADGQPSKAVGPHGRGDDPLVHDAGPDGNPAPRVN